MASGPAMSGRAVYAVLGMHRSGTSWLAGSLEEKGLALGEVNTAATYNKRGTRENEAIQSLHDGVLRSSGGSWRDPPRRVDWSEERRAALADTIAAMDATHGSWGFKDPRALLLLDEWRRQLGDRLVLVGIYRHPVAVAQSLAKRQFSPVPPRDGVRLWRAYNERLVAEHRRAPFPILRFDTEGDRLLAALDQVAKEWRLPAAGRPSTFFDPGLVDEGAGEAAVPWRCRRIWSYLRQHTLEA